MAKIKKINYHDIVQVKKLISLICSGNIVSYRRLLFLSVPITFIQNLIYSVIFRKFPETYVISDNSNNLKGVITVKAQFGNPFKWQIRRLFLDSGSYDEGKQLIEYIIAKFGARGVDTFYAAVEDNQTDLIDLFIKGCGFRFCSNEAIWTVSNFNFINENPNDQIFHSFKNSDCERTAELYNENLITHYKYSLTKDKAEFADRFFQGFNSDSDFKYVVEDEKTHRLKAFVEIKTPDNKNYYVDSIVAQQCTDFYPEILSFAIKQIIKRNKNFKLFIRNRKYLQCGEFCENYLKENKFEMIYNKAILVKDFFKTIKEENHLINNAIVLNGNEI